MVSRFKFSYRNQEFRWRAPSNDPAADLRFEAFRTFLRLQPQIRNETWSLSDVEFLFEAARHSFQTASPQGNLNIPQQRFRLSNGSRMYWGKTAIPKTNYFLEVFCFLHRRDLVQAQALTQADARRLLGQPCHLRRCTVDYLQTSWPFILDADHMDFFTSTISTLQRTVCFQQQIWNRTEFLQLWDSLHCACNSSDHQIQLDRQYSGHRWRRSIPIHSIIAAAELLHFLRNSPSMPLNHFLHCFDACLHRPASEWDFWCQSTDMRQASLADACATTSMDPRFYTSDLHSAPSAHCSQDDSDRSRRLMHYGAEWPSAIPLSDQFSQLKNYRTRFETHVQPPKICAFCACGIWADGDQILDLRQLPCDVTLLHPILSAHLWLERQTPAEQPLPHHFQPLSLQHLRDFFPAAPTEVAEAALVTCPTSLPTLFHFQIEPASLHCLLLTMRCRIFGCFIFQTPLQETFGALQHKILQVLYFALYVRIALLMCLRVVQLCLRVLWPTTMLPYHHLLNCKTYPWVSRCSLRVVLQSVGCAL